MDKRAVEQARLELNRAWNSIQLLGGTNEIADVRVHWTAFLVAAARMFNKLEQGTKATLKSKVWFGAKVHQRRTNPLLAYIWHARNAEEHTLREISQRSPGFLKEIIPSTQGEREKFFRANPDLPKPITGLVYLEIINPQIRLVPVIDRGACYAPPANCVLPLQAGMIALTMLDQIILEAEALANPSDVQAP